MNDLVARGEIVFGKHFVSHKNIFSHLEQDKTCLGFFCSMKKVYLSEKAGAMYSRSQDDCACMCVGEIFFKKEL